MKKEYISALQWLFGDEVIVQEFPKAFSLDDGDTLYSNRPNDIPNICDLIDKTLLKREDVGGYSSHHSKVEPRQELSHYYNIWDANGDETTNEAESPDPLTARLEALVELMRKQ